LARAISTESAVALKYWWGVSTKAAWHWRKALSVDQWGTPGSKRLHAAVVATAREATAGVPLPPEAVELRRERAIRLNLGRRLIHGYHGPRWTAKQIKMLGKRPDAEVAQLTGRTKNAVRIKRERLKIREFEG